MDTPMTDAHEWMPGDDRYETCATLERKVNQLEADKRELVEALERVTKFYAAVTNDHPDDALRIHTLEHCEAALAKHKAQS